MAGWETLAGHFRVRPENEPMESTCEEPATKMRSDSACVTASSAGYRRPPGHVPRLRR